MLSSAVLICCHLFFFRRLHSFPVWGLMVKSPFFLDQGNEFWGPWKAIILILLCWISIISVSTSLVLADLSYHHCIYIHILTSRSGVRWWSLCSPDTLQSEGGSTRCGHYTGTVGNEGSPRSPAGSVNTGDPWPLKHTRSGRWPRGTRGWQSPEGHSYKLWGWRD